MNQGSKIQYRIYRHPEGIGLNGKEFAVDDNKDIILFNTVNDAEKFLIKAIGKKEEDVLKIGNPISTKLQ